MTREGISKLSHFGAVVVGAEVAAAALRPPGSVRWLLTFLNLVGMIAKKP